MREDAGLPVGGNIDKEMLLIDTVTMHRFIRTSVSRVP